MTCSAATARTSAATGWCDEQLASSGDLPANMRHVNDVQCANIFLMHSWCAAIGAVTLKTAVTS